MTSVTTTKTVNLTQLTAELGGVGLSMVGDGNSDGEKTITGDLEMAILDAAIAAHSYTPPVWIDKEIWKARLTNSEYSAIWASTDPIVMRLRDKLNGWNGPLNLADGKPDGMINGVSYLAIVPREDAPQLMIIEFARIDSLLAPPE